MKHSQSPIMGLGSGGDVDTINPILGSRHTRFEIGLPKFKLRRQSAVKGPDPPIHAAARLSENAARLK